MSIVILSCMIWCCRLTYKLNGLCDSLDMCDIKVADVMNK
jgi:hypothetical protein